MNIRFIIIVIACVKVLGLNAAPKVESHSDKIKVRVALSRTIAPMIDKQVENKIKFVFGSNKNYKTTREIDLNLWLKKREQEVNLSIQSMSPGKKASIEQEHEEEMKKLDLDVEKKAFNIPQDLTITSVETLD